MGTFLILFPILYIVILGFITSQANTLFAESVEDFQAAWPDIDDFDTILGTDYFAYLGALFSEFFSKMAAFFTAGFALLLPWDIELYGQTVNTGAFAVINLGMVSLVVLYFKDTIMGIVGAIMP